MQINYPVYGNPIKTINITPKTIIGEKGNKFVVYEWSGAEVAEIQDLPNGPVRSIPIAGVQ